MANPDWLDPGKFEWDDPDEAVAFLKSRGINHHRGMFTQPEGHVMREDEYAALDYLCCDWDYGFTPAWDGRRTKDGIIGNLDYGAPL
jgi:hypothetical protein